MKWKRSYQPEYSLQNGRLSGQVRIPRSTDRLPRLSLLLRMSLALFSSLSQLLVLSDLTEESRANEHTPDPRVCQPLVDLFSSGHYETLQKWIFGQRWRYGQASLRFSDYSVPKDDPIHDAPTAAALMAAILKKMVRCHVVIVPTGMYATHGAWGKPMDRKGNRQCNGKGEADSGVNPWGQQRRSGVVVGAASRIVGWNRKSVVGAIWDLYRQ